MCRKIQHLTLRLLCSVADASKTPQLFSHVFFPLLSGGLGGGQTSSLKSTFDKITSIHVSEVFRVPEGHLAVRILRQLLFCCRKFIADKLGTDKVHTGPLQFFVSKKHSETLLYERELFQFEMFIFDGKQRINKCYELSKAVCLTLRLRTYFTLTKFYFIWRTHSRNITQWLYM